MPLAGAANALVGLSMMGLLFWTTREHWDRSLLWWRCWVAWCLLAMSVMAVQARWWGVVAPIPGLVLLIVSRQKVAGQPPKGR